MPRTILVLLSEYGYWGEELVGPLFHFDKAGYGVVFATANGNRAHVLPPSIDPTYVDPPLGRTVTSHEVADMARILDESDRLDNPLSLAGWIPERLYTSAPNYLRELEDYNRRLAAVDDDIRDYDALLLVGGSGPIVDMANNERVHALVLAFLKAGKLIGAECYGVTCLAFARDWENRESIIRGKHVTGHCKEYDYKDGTGFLGTDFVMGPPPYPLEYILRDATAPDGRYHGNFGHEDSVIVDWPFVTGRSNNDSFLTGQKMVETLDDGLRRWGW
jgi:putative intracellular protease/amidase